MGIDHHSVHVDEHICIDLSYLRKRLHIGHDEREKKQMLAMEIKRQRKVLMLTQEQLAEKVGVSPTTVHRWEAGRSTPLGVNRTRLMETLQLDASLFLREAPVGSTIPTSSGSSCAVHIHIHLTVSDQEQPAMVHSHISQLQPEDELSDVIQWIAQQLNVSQHPGPSSC